MRMMQRTPPSGVRKEENVSKYMYLVRHQLLYHCHLHLGVTDIILSAKKPGPKLLSVSNQARMEVFVRKEILIPPGARCCADHLISA